MLTTDLLNSSRISLEYKEELTIFNIQVKRAVGWMKLDNYHMSLTTKYWLKLRKDPWVRDYGYLKPHRCFTSGKSQQLLIYFFSLMKIQ